MPTINRTQNLMANANNLFNVIMVRLIPTIAHIHHLDVAVMHRDSRRSAVIGLSKGLEEAVQDAVVLWKGSIAQDLAEAKAAMDKHGKDYLLTADAAIRSVETYLACKPNLLGLDATAEATELAALKQRYAECEKQDKLAAEAAETKRAHDFVVQHSQPCLLLQQYLRMDLTPARSDVCRNRVFGIRRIYAPCMYTAESLLFLFS